MLIITFVIPTSGKEAFAKANQSVQHRSHISAEITWSGEVERHPGAHHQARYLPRKVRHPAGCSTSFLGENRRPTGHTVFGRLCFTPTNFI